MGFRVEQQYRINPLSKQPGGVVVCVEQENGKIYEYDNVKCPIAYIKKIQLEHPFMKIKCWWDKNDPGNVYRI